METRREILFNSLPDNQLQTDTQNKKYFKIEFLMIPVKIFYRAEKITFIFPNISDASKEIIVINNKDNSIQNFYACSVAINRFFFKEYNGHYVYNSKKLDRVFNCNGKVMNRDEIHIKMFDNNGKEISFCKSESNIRMILCFYS